MSEKLKKVGKLLLGGDRDEIRTRAAQSLSARAESWNLSAAARLPEESELGKLVDPAAPENSSPVCAESLLSDFRRRASPKFFAAFDDPAATRRDLRRRFGAQSETSLLERAGRISEGRFDLLGRRDLHFGTDVNWHLEPVSGKEAPRRHWSRLNYLDPSVAGDKKFIWELNRHQYFATLGRAYWLTGDERHAETFARHINSWMKHNLPKQGINWASSLEVSFRSISWLWALYFFKDSPHLDAPLMALMLRHLYVHARHLETYLSTYFSPNTHLTGEALGLFYLGTLLPQFRRAGVWRAKGRKILLDELKRHVKADGVYFEQSSYYHRYTTDFYTHFLLLARANNDALPSEVETKLTLLLDHLMYITRPDGTTPLFGDDDGGRLVMLAEQEAKDFRATLATGALLFKRADYKFVAGEFSEETFWLLGSEAARDYDNLAAHAPAQTSRAFPDGGYYVMRDGWEREANYLLLDCGPHGALNCGHAHADALGFDLAARGRTLLVDPGTYTYTGSKEMRDYFRSSAAHNTLTIDGQSSSETGGAFTWKHIARCSVQEWISREQFDFFKGAHDGYARLPEPAMHARSVLFLKRNYWVMRDEVTTTGAHRYDLHFHFAPDAHPVFNDDAEENGANRLATANVLRERAAHAAGLDLAAFAPAAGWRVETGLVSQRYGEHRPAPVCVLSGAASGAYEAITFLLPRAAGSAKAGAREIEARGGRAFEIELDDNSAIMHDVLLLSEGREIEAARFVSNFRWTWARRAGRDVVPREWVLLEGSRFACDGQEIFRSSERVAYAAARIAGDELRLDVSDLGGDLRVLIPRCVRRVAFNKREFPINGEARLRFQHGGLQSEAAREAYETLV
ncbi:MAG: alginate lyase family protein [Pyrinomonadaceae bacterium]